MRQSRQWFANTAGDCLRLIRWVPRRRELYLRFSTHCGLSSPLTSRSFLLKVAKDLIVRPRLSFSWEVEKPLRVDKDGDSMVLVVLVKESPLTSRLAEGVISTRLNETRFSWQAPASSEKEKSAAEPLAQPETAGKVLPFVKESV